MIRMYEWKLVITRQTLMLQRSHTNASRAKSFAHEASPDWLDVELSFVPFLYPIKIIENSLSLSRV